MQAKEQLANNPLTPVVRLHKVSKFYGEGDLLVKALDQINLEVKNCCPPSIYLAMKTFKPSLGLGLLISVADVVPP